MKSELTVMGFRSENVVLQRLCAPSGTLGCSATEPLLYAVNTNELANPI